MKPMHAPSKLIPAELLLMAYRGGIFPMADDREDEEVYWVEPRRRAILPLDRFRCSRSLARTLRRERFAVTCNAEFAAVIDACAEPRPEHPKTWISYRIAASYNALHLAGHAHSIECWQDGELVGGLYGVAFDRVFCGESMFSRRPDASKVALAWLIAALRRGGYMLHDCQFMTAHLASLGAVEITRETYVSRLGAAVAAGGGSTGAAGEGLGDGVGRGAALDLPEAFAALLSDAEAVGSSPGKLIAQSLTHTS
jgi:leucyl/phenylalanyl-tRNA--protein transferase